MNAAIANLLNKLLGVWIEDLNREQLNLSIFSGTIRLDKVRLKPDFLNILGLPFELANGTVDTIRIKIPWATWYSSPLEISIFNVSILLVPTSVSQWSSQKETEIIVKLQQYYLEHFEIMNPDCVADNNEEGYIGILTGKILENLQVTVENLYVRYEDPFSSSEPFSLGMHLKNARVFSCNNLWENEFRNDTSVCYKLCQCEEFSMFLDYSDGIVRTQQWYEGNLNEALAGLIRDETGYKIFHKYIVWPMAYKLEVVLNRDTDRNKLPPLSINFLSDKAKVQMYLVQAECLIAMRKLIDSYWKFKKSVEESIENRSFTLEEIASYRKAYFEFRMQYYSEETPFETKETLKIALEVLESGIFIDDVKIQRKAVLMEIKLKKVEIEKKEEILKMNQETHKKKPISSRILEVLTRKSEAARKQVEEARLARLRTAEKDLIRVETRTSSIIREFNRGNPNKIKFHEDTIEQVLSASIQDFSFELFNEQGELLKLGTKSLLFSFAIRLATSHLKLKMQQIKIWNYYEKDSLFPVLFCGDYLEIEFDDLDNKKLKVHMAGVKACVDVKSMEKVLELILKSFPQSILDSESDQSDSIKTDEDLPLVQRTLRFLMEVGIVNRYELDVDLTRIEISLPIDVKDETTAIVGLGLEKFLVTTTKETIRRLTFDVYHIEIKEAKVFTKVSGESSRNIIAPVCMNWQLYVCKIRQFNRSGYRIKATVSKTQVFLSDWQIQIFAALAKSLTLPSTDLNFEFSHSFSENSYSKEHNNLGSLILSLEEIIKSKILIEISEISVTFIRRQEAFMNLKLKRLITEVKLTKHKHLNARLSLETIELSYITEVSDWKPIISIPIFQSDSEFQDAKQEIYNVYASVCLIAQENFYDLVLRVTEAKAIAIFPFFTKFFEFVNEIFPVDEDRQEENQIIVIIPEENINVHNLRLSIDIENHEIWLPIEKESSWKAVAIYFSSTFIFESVRKLVVQHGSRSPISKLLEKSVNVTAQFSNLRVKLSNSLQIKNFIRPTRICFEYDSRSTANNSQITKAEFRLECTYIEIGFRDLDFFYKLQELWTSKKNTKNSGTKGHEIVTYIVHSDNLKIILQEDTIKHPYSLLAADIKNLCITFTPTSILTSCSISSNFYNTVLKAWEPMSETWKFLMKYEKNQNFPIYLYEFSSPFSLNVNITNQMVECIGIAMKRYYENYLNWGPMYKKPILPQANLNYQIINNLGTDILLWVDSKYPEQILLKDQGKIDISYKEIERVYLRNDGYKFVSQSRAHAISIYLPDFEHCSGILIEDNSSQTFEVVGENTVLRLRKDVIIRENTRFITLSHSLVVVNTSTQPIIILCNFVEFVVENIFHVPIDCKLDQVFIKTFGGSQCILEKKIFQYSAEIFLCVEVKDFEYQGAICEQSFIITSPYIFQNTLPFPLIFYINEEEIQKIPAGQTWNFYSIGVTSAEFRFDILENDRILQTENFNLENTISNVKIRNQYNWSLLVAVNQDSECIKVVISCDSIFVNCTEYDLSFKNFAIPQKTAGLVHGAKKLLRMRSKGEVESEYSEKISLSALGISECISLNVLDGPYKKLQIGVNILQSPLATTKIVRFLPRFIIANYLYFPIYIRQFSAKFKTRPIRVIPHSSIHYQLDDSLQNSIIQVSEDIFNWSGPFLLTDLQDFQIRFLSQNNSNQGKDLPWSSPSKSNHMHQYVRVVITSENQATININLQIPLQPDFVIRNCTNEVIFIKQFKFKQEYFQIPSEESLPWTFDNQLIGNRKVKLKLLGFKECYLVEEVQESYKDLGSCKVKGYCQGNSRVLEVFENCCPLIEASREGIIEESHWKYRFKLENVNFSVVDRRNIEKVFLSFGDVEANYKKKVVQASNIPIVHTKLSLIIGNFQVDNMDQYNKLFPVILFRTNIDTETPFFEFKYHHEYSYIENLIDTIHYFELQMQPVSLYINHEVLLSLFAIQSDFVNSFYCISLSNPYKPDLNSLVSPQLDPLNPSAEPIKTYFKFIRVQAVEMCLTFRKSKKIQILPQLPSFFRFLSNTFVDFAGITESPLSFKQIVIQHSYQNRYSLLWAFVSNYSKQGLFQFYRVLGATQALGNPIGLLNKLGTGVYEFFSEPAKGLLISPKAFLLGMGKGTKSLVRNVAYGGLTTVAGITGSLYNVVSEEYSESQTFYKDSGLIDLSLGMKNIAIKPYQGFKNKGILGLAGGTIEGIFGASLAPVAALLHFSHSLTSKAADEIEKIHTSKPKRKRFPRYISSNKLLDLYNPHLAKLGTIIQRSKLLKNCNIRHFIELDKENIILTSQKIFILSGSEVIFEIDLAKIVEKEIHYYMKCYQLMIYTDKAYYLSCKKRETIYKLYLVIDY